MRASFQPPTALAAKIIANCCEVARNRVLRLFEQILHSVVPVKSINSPKFLALDVSHTLLISVHKSKSSGLNVTDRVFDEFQ
jgi:hypothetical protein